MKLDDPWFLNCKTGATINVLELWQATINSQPLFYGLPPGAAPKAVKVNLQSSSHPDYDFVTEDGRTRIVDIEFDATLTVSVPQMPLTQAAQYVSQHGPKQDKEVFVTLGHWSGSENDIVRGLTILAIPKRSDQNSDRSAVYTAAPRIEWVATPA